MPCLQPEVCYYDTAKGHTKETHGPVEQKLLANKQPNKALNGHSAGGEMHYPRLKIYYHQHNELWDTFCCPKVKESIRARGIVLRTRP